MRRLEALGVRAEQYDSSLIPIIMAKLPPEIRLQIARVTNKNIWKVAELLQVIKAVKSETPSRRIKANHLNHHHPLEMGDLLLLHC